MFKHIKNNKGFSLVELMVVVAIIGILAAIAVPTFTGFQKKARTAEGKNLLGSLYVTVKAVEAEKGNKLIASYDLGLEGLSATGIYNVYGFATAHTTVAGTTKSSVAAAATLRSGDSATSTGANCDYATQSSWKAGALPHTKGNADQLNMDHNRNIEVSADEASNPQNACNA